MTMIAGMKIHEKEGFSKYGIKKLKNKKSASLYLYKTKGVKMKKYLLLSFLTIVSLGLVFLVIFTFYTEKSKNLSMSGLGIV